MFQSDLTHIHVYKWHVSGSGMTTTKLLNCHACAVKKSSKSYRLQCVTCSLVWSFPINVPKMWSLLFTLILSLLFSFLFLLSPWCEVSALSDDDRQHEHKMLKATHTNSDLTIQRAVAWLRIWCDHIHDNRQKCPTSDMKKSDLVYSHVREKNIKSESLGGKMNRIWTPSACNIHVDENAFSWSLCWLSGNITVTPGGFCPLQTNSAAYNSTKYLWRLSVMQGRLSGSWVLATARLN